MVKRRHPTYSTPGAKQKRLRKQLRKAEKKLRKAEARRDQANATVEALSIIVDEIRTTIADERPRSIQQQRGELRS